MSEQPSRTGEGDLHSDDGQTAPPEPEETAESVEPATEESLESEEWAQHEPALPSGDYADDAG